MKNTTFLFLCYCIYDFHVKVLGVLIDIRTIDKRIFRKKMKDYLTKNCAGSGSRGLKVLDPADPGSGSAALLYRHGNAQLVNTSNTI
jgi:hypothetical protein